MTEIPGYTDLDDDRCYYGSDGKVVVQRLRNGKLVSSGSKVLVELTSPDPIMTFNWGYIGSGANMVSIAILADALEVPAEKITLPIYQAFTGDFVSQFPAEFRIRRYAVLRWVRGYFCLKGTHNFPAEVPEGDPNTQRRVSRAVTDSVSG
jgi:hypothetical protein